MSLQGNGGTSTVIRRLVPSTGTVWLAAIVNVAGSCGEGRVGDSPHATVNISAIKAPSAAPRVIVVIQSSVLHGAGIAPRHTTTGSGGARRVSSHVSFGAGTSKVVPAMARRRPRRAGTVTVRETASDARQDNRGRASRSGTRWQRATVPVVSRRDGRWPHGHGRDMTGGGRKRPSMPISIDPAARRISGGPRSQRTGSSPQLAGDQMRSSAPAAEGGDPATRSAGGPGTSVAPLPAPRPA